MAIIMKRHFAIVKQTKSTSTQKLVTSTDFERDAD
jgi:hypothetical protein